MRHRQGPTPGGHLIPVAPAAVAAATTALSMGPRPGPRVTPLGWHLAEDLASMLGYAEAMDAEAASAIVRHLDAGLPTPRLQILRDRPAAPALTALAWPATAGDATGTIPTWACFGIRASSHLAAFADPDPLDAPSATTSADPGATDARVVLAPLLRVAAAHRAEALVGFGEAAIARALVAACDGAPAHARTVVTPARIEALLSAPEAATRTAGMLLTPHLPSRV